MEKKKSEVEKTEKEEERMGGREAVTGMTTTEKQSKSSERKSEAEEEEERKGGREAVTGTLDDGEEEAVEVVGEVGAGEGVGGEKGRLRGL